MRKLILALAVMLAGLGPCLAVECPAGSSPEPLTAFRWEYSIVPGRPASVLLSIQNHSNKQVRMVDGDVYFEDGLGRLLGHEPLPLNPDLQIFAGKANSFRAPLLPGYERLAEAVMADYQPLVCTRAILFKDGTRLTF